MNNKLSMRWVGIGALVLALPLAASAQQAFTRDTVNMRAGPSGDYPLVARLAPGAPDAGGAQSGRPEQEIDATAPAQARQSFEQVAHPSSTVEPAAAGAPQHQAFWALVPEERDVVDEIGIPVFRVGPSAWALVIEDRGEAFVVRHEDGRIGYLHDVSGVTRG